MKSFEDAKQTFRTHEDYLKLAQTIYEACRAFSSYKKSWEEETVYSVPFCWEIQYVLNHPDATPEKLWEAYKALFHGSDPYFTHEVYMDPREDWQILIALTNALRHTITPANVSY